MLPCLLFFAAGILVYSQPNSNDCGRNANVSKASLPCRLKLPYTYVPPEITWHKVSVLAPARSEKVMTIEDPKYYDLTRIIQPVTDDDAGLYFCRASTQMGHLDGETSLLAPNEGPWVLITGPVTELPESTDFLTYTWTCEGFGVDMLKWTFSGLTRAQNEMPTINSSAGEHRVLSNFTLRQARGRARKEFCLHCAGYCQNKQRVNSTCLPSALVPPGPPVVSNGPTTTFTTWVGATLTLPCLVRAAPPVHTIYWYKEYVQMEFLLGRVFGGSLYHPSLTFLNVHEEDEGSYICRAFNDVGTNTGSWLRVILAQDGLPVILNETLTDFATPFGVPLTLPCNVTSPTPVIKVTWYKDGAVLNATTSSSSDDVFGGTPERPSLTIRRVAFRDEGVYICSATNRQGTRNGTKPMSLMIADNARSMGKSALAMTIGFPLVALVVGLYLLLLWCMGRRDLLPKWCPIGSGRSRRTPKKFTLDLNRVGSSVNSVLQGHCQAIGIHEQLAREECQSTIPSMGPGGAKVALLSLSHNLPLHVLLHLGLTTPVNTNRVVSDPPPEWCACGECVATEQAADRLCCGVKDCVTRDPVFVDLCMKPHIVEILGVQSDAAQQRGFVKKEKHRRKAGSPDFSCSAFREQASRFYLLWQLGQRSGFQRPQVPSCVSVRIRWAFPDDGGVVSRRF